jgi:hypothetical protein
MLHVAIRTVGTLIVGATVAALLISSLVFVGAIESTSETTALFWSLPGLLALAGAMWALDKSIPLVVLACVLAAAASLSIYFAIWSNACQHCLAGEWDRETALGFAWRFIGLLTSGGVAILLTGAVASAVLRFYVTYVERESRV